MVLTDWAPGWIKGYNNNSSNKTTWNVEINILTMESHINKVNYSWIQKKLLSVSTMFKWIELKFFTYGNEINPIRIKLKVVIRSCSECVQSSMALILSSLLQCFPTSKLLIGRSDGNIWMIFQRCRCRNNSMLKTHIYSVRYRYSNYWKDICYWFSELVRFTTWIF